MFKPVSSRVSFPKMEEEVLSFWKEHQIFERSVAERKQGPRFTLYEGPPTANGSPGIHHVLARVFKDVMPRYKTMKGFCAPRKGGWDTHGLPVELEVEKELNISSKPEIESYGIGEFNARCRESVFRYVKDWVAMTERIGFWIDMDNPYVTLDNGYIESCWWILKQLWEKGLIYHSTKTVPHCPRCMTTLSSHEVALGYKEDTPDPSVYVKFAVTPDLKGASEAAKLRLAGSRLPTYLLAWTTTPWTLPGNTALTVAPDATYAVLYLPQRQERLVMAQSLVSATVKEEAFVVGTLKGGDLAGLHYRPLYSPFEFEMPVWRFPEPGSRILESVMKAELGGEITYPVITGDFVSLEDGTGIVHTAPAFGEVDHEAGIAHGLYYVQPVDLQGKMTGGYPFTGLFVKAADPLIMDDLTARGLLYRREVYRHTYPFCWRCDTPLLYYAKGSWYIQTTALKDKLIEGNEKIHWYPGYIKDGRFGDWLRNNVDWAISRERYWGTPLPFWVCTNHLQAKFECIGSRDELKNKRGLTGWQEDLDLHRPYIDAVTYQCECGSTMRRVPEVIDCWFDSGAMPFAQWHYPFENAGIANDGRFPADYICEAVDQTRGWFYSLHAISTLLTGEPCYENVICLGLILDSQGEKMSKSRGNVVVPWTVIAQHGADALRWYLLTATPPGNARRFSSDLVGEVIRRFCLTLWNTYSFFVTYANLDGFNPRDGLVEKPQSELDRWVLSELGRLVEEVSGRLDDYDPTEAGRRIEAFVEDLSTWYVRRSRRRFWKSESDDDKRSAYSTLYRCLVTLSRLLAPLVPFMAEEMYRNLVRSFDLSAPESVHLDHFPEAKDFAREPELEQATRLAVKICSLGRAARSKAGIKVRQPLKRAKVIVRHEDEMGFVGRVDLQIMDELNIKELEFTLDPKGAEQYVDYQVKLNTALAGPKYGRDLPRIIQGLNRLSPREVASRVQGGERVTVEGIELLPEELQVSTVDKPMWATAREGGYLVVVDRTITPSLKDEGMARELVHQIQNMRRSAGFEIADRIDIVYQGSPEMGRIIASNRNYIKQETLALSLTRGRMPKDCYKEPLTLEGEQVTLGLKRR